MMNKTHVNFRKNRAKKYFSNIYTADQKFHYVPCWFYDKPNTIDNPHNILGSGIMLYANDIAVSDGYEGNSYYNDVFFSTYADANAFVDTLYNEWIGSEDRLKLMIQEAKDDIALKCSTTSDVMNDYDAKQQYLDNNRIVTQNGIGDQFLGCALYMFYDHADIYVFADMNDFMNSYNNIEMYKFYNLITEYRDTDESIDAFQCYNKIWKTDLHTILGEDDLIEALVPFTKISTRHGMHQMASVVYKYFYDGKYKDIDKDLIKEDIVSVLREIETFKDVSENTEKKEVKEEQKSDSPNKPKGLSGVRLTRNASKPQKLSDVVEDEVKKAASKIMSADYNNNGMIDTSGISDIYYKNIFQLYEDAQKTYSGPIYPLENTTVSVLTEPHYWLKVVDPDNTNVDSESYKLAWIAYYIYPEVITMFKTEKRVNYITVEDLIEEMLSETHYTQHPEFGTNVVVDDIIKLFDEEEILNAIYKNGQFFRYDSILLNGVPYFKLNLDPINCVHLYRVHFDGLKRFSDLAKEAPDTKLYLL